MKAFTKFLLFALFMATLPLQNWAQTPYRQYADEGILLNAYEIDNVGFRVFLLYNLHQDDSFDVIANDEPGQFSIVPGHNGNTVNFIETFESAYRRAYADFSLFTKPEIDNYLSVWKSNIPPKHYISLTLDIELRHSRPSNNHCADSDPFCTSESYTFDAAFPNGQVVVDLRLGKKAEIRRGSLVGGLKSIQEVLYFSVVAWDDAELPWLLIGQNVKTAVLMELVEQEYPEINIVDFVGVQQDALVGILSVRCLRPILYRQCCQ